MGRRDGPLVQAMVGRFTIERAGEAYLALRSGLVEAV
jgi:hypothetical protein